MVYDVQLDVNGNGGELSVGKTTRQAFLRANNFQCD